MSNHIQGGDRDIGKVVVNQIFDLGEGRTLMGFKETFVRLRKEHGWTQQQVSEKIGISLGQVKKYEKGVSAPTLTILAKIAKTYSVSADEIVFGTTTGLAGQKLDAEMLRRFELVAQLPERERDAVLVVLDSVIAKHRLREVMSS